MNFQKNIAYLTEVKPALRSQFSGWDLWINGEDHPSPGEWVRLSELSGYSLEDLLNKNLRQIRKWHGHRPRLILLDVDGTLSDGGMYYTESGDQIKQFNVKDGMIIHRLIRRQGVMFGLISSGSTGAIIQNRAATLGIERVYFGRRPKVEVIEEWLAELGITWADIAYVGDDLNDLPAIEAAGVSACPSDAAWQVRQAADVVLRLGGGQGCVREFLEEVLGYEI